MYYKVSLINKRLEFSGGINMEKNDSNNSMEIALLGSHGGTADTAIENINHQGFRVRAWSFPIKEHDAKKYLTKKPFVLYVSFMLSPQYYIAAGMRGRYITHRLIIDDYRSKAGNSGMASPWPDLTKPEHRGQFQVKRQDTGKNFICKTWLLVSHIEELKEPKKLSDFVDLKTGNEPKFHLNAFNYVLVK